MMFDASQTSRLPTPDPLVLHPLNEMEAARAVGRIARAGAALAAHGSPGS